MTSDGGVSRTGGSPLRPGYSVGRHLFPLAAGFILVSGSLVGATLAYLRTQTIESGERFTESLAQVIEEQTERTIQTVDQRLQLAQAGLATLNAAGRLNEASARSVLSEQMKEMRFFGGLFVLDASGRLVFSSGTSNVGLDLEDRAYFQIYREHPETQFYLGAPVRGRTTGTWGLPAARPLGPIGGKFTGIVAAGVQPDYFDQLWRQIALGAGGSIALFRRDGVLMTRTPFDDAAMGKSFQDRPLFATLATSPTGTFHDSSPIDGVVRILSYQTLSEYPDLFVVVGRSYDVALAPWRRQAAVALTIWATASLVIVGLSLFLNHAWRQRLISEVRGQHMAERLALATNSTSIAVWDWDVTTGRMDASPNHFTMLGRDPEEQPVSREQWLERIHVEDRAGIEAKIRATLEGRDGGYRYEARLRHEDGSFRWVSEIASVLGRDEEGKATRLLGVREDITERKEFEEALRSSEQRFRTIFETEPACVKVVGADGRLLELNAAGLTMLEADSLVEVKGRPLAEFIQSEHRAAVDGLFRRTLAGDACSLEYEVIGLRGGRRWLESHTAPMRDADGSVTMMLGVSRDITHRRQADEALRKSLSEKEALLKEVHHRVKNNLQVINSLLRLEAGRTAHASTKSVLRDMQGRIKSMALLHETLYRSGTFASVDLGAYIRQLTTQSFRALNAQPGAIQLDLDLASVHIEIDQAIPCGLLINELISNGLKHGFPGGRNGRIRVELQPLDGGPQLRLRVSDTGVGLPADFESRRGASLGLQLVSDLARQLTGALEVGPDASFTITFAPRVLDARGTGPSD